MIALASVAGVLAWVAVLGEPASRAATTFQEVISTAPAATLSIAMLFLGTAVLRDERDGGTLPFLFISPIGRVAFALSAWVALTMAALLIAFIGWLPALFGAGLSAGDWSLAFPVLGLYAAAAVAYSAVFLPLGYLFSRSLLVGLGYVFIWEGIIASFVPGLAASSVWRLALSIYAGVVDLPRDAMDVLGSVKPGAGGGIVSIAALVAVALAVLSWAIRRRDAV
ncbi:MAG: hypothetical protein OEW91_13410, partial [Acidimicrobiia bacterium]|nr:hypothetical protein [Acidimicrobiia bacterium]